MGVKRQERTGCEFYRLPLVFTNIAPKPDLEVNVQGTSLWVNAETVDEGWKFFGIGPEADTEYPGLPLRRGLNVIQARVAGNPEVVIRSAGVIHVY
jgi:hypothetical protein